MLQKERSLPKQLGSSRYLNPLPLKEPKYYSHLGTGTIIILVNGIFPAVMLFWPLTQNNLNIS